MWHPERKSIIPSSAMNPVFSLYQNVDLSPTNTKCISQVFVFPTKQYIENIMTKLGLFQRLQGWFDIQK